MGFLHARVKGEHQIFDPEMKAVWDDYSLDLEREELLDLGRDLLYLCVTPNELDLALNNLLRRKETLVVQLPLNQFTLESPCSWDDPLRDRKSVV